MLPTFEGKLQEVALYLAFMTSYVLIRSIPNRLGQSPNRGMTGGGIKIPIGELIVIDLFGGFQTISGSPIRRSI